MKIYITGSSGFIGSSLINYLLNSQHSLILETSNNELVTNSKYKKPGVRVVNFGDNKNRLKYLSECGTVIHLAWSSSPSTRIDQYEDVYKVDILNSISLFNDCALAGIKKIIFISSGGTVYGDTGIVALSEEDPTNPVSIYGLNKLTIERYLKIFSDENSITSIIVRPSNIYGDPGRNGTPKGAIATWTHNALKGKSIDFWGEIDTVRDYLYMDDFLDFLDCVLHYNKSNIFNVGTSIGLSRTQIVEKIKKVLEGCDIHINYIKNYVREVESIKLNIDKAKKELGWSPSTSIEQGIMSIKKNFYK